MDGLALSIFLSPWQGDCFPWLMDFNYWSMDFFAFKMELLPCQVFRFPCQVFKISSGMRRYIALFFTWREFLQFAVLLMFVYSSLFSKASLTVDSFN
jgi:hypothetical protein